MTQILKDIKGDLTDHYENGDIILLQDIRFKYIDYDLIYKAGITQLNHIPMKKAKSHWLMSAIRNASYKEHPLYNFFPHSINKAIEFQRLIKSFNKNIQRVCAERFPGYKIVDRDQWSWRFCETKEEPIHIDSYSRGDHNNHLLRVFYNLDVKPRIWRTTYALPELLQKLIQYRTKELLLKLHPNHINAIINEILPLSDYPYIQFEIPPRSIMFCNTQIVSHQIWYGTKLAAYSFVVDPTSMNKPELNFVQQVRHFLENN